MTVTTSSNRSRQQARDIERFRWFSNGYIARDPVYANRVIDVRYSMIPNAVEPLWSIEVRRDANDSEHAAYLVHRDTSSGRLTRMWSMLSGG